jgi:hypothetical protein
MAEPTFANIAALLPFDEASISDAGDQSAHITLTGLAGTSATQAKFGARSLRIPSGDSLSIQVAEFSFFDVFDPTGQFTFQAWVRPDAIGSAQTILYVSGFWFGINASGELELVGDNSGTVVSATSTGTLSAAGSFYYVEINRDASGDWRIFLDGTLEATASESGNVTSGAQVVTIGLAPFSGSDRPFEGYIDDLRLTEGETLNTASYTAPTSAHSTGTPTSSAYLSVPTPLGTPQPLMLVAENISARASVPSPLKTPSLLALRAEAVALYMSVPTPLGAPAYSVENDFSSLVTDPTAQYVLKITGSPPLEVPISSWQSTVQLANASFLQVVIPSYTPYAEEIAARQANSDMVIYRRLSVGGEVFDTEIARSGLDTIQMADGPRRSTMTIQGYTSAFDGTAPAKTVALQNVRTAFQTVGGASRVRADIDWLLRPGQTVQHGSNTFTAQYINYFVPSVGDAYMDVGERG